MLFRTHAHQHQCSRQKPEAPTMPQPRSKLEVTLERVLFASRWLLAPFYLGMILALAALLFVFGWEPWTFQA
jgi:uncharacterized membrane protein YqhA